MSDEPRQTYVPVFIPSDRAWMDPRLFAVNLYDQVDDYQIDAVTPSLVAPADPNRWAIGFTLAPPVMDGAVFAPFTDITSGTGRQAVGTEIRWYDMPTYGTLVQRAWYGVGGAGSVMRVVQVLRK